MAARRRSRKAEKDLSERQRFWLKHLRAAERKNVIVIRYTDGRRYAYKLDLAGSKIKPFYLQPRDIVHVPLTRIVKLNQWIDKNIDNLIGNAGLFAGRTSKDSAVFAGAHR